MKNILICSIILTLFSCEKEYSVISNNEINKFAFRDTLVDNEKNFVFKLGDSISDPYSQIVVSPKDSNSDTNYLFDFDAELENDSVVSTFAPPFIIDGSGGFKNGVWVYTTFTTTGTFPFTKKSTRYSVDSIPKGWNKKLPRKKGIYYYKNNSLILISKEQSDDKFSENEIDGFYFIPGNGKLLKTQIKITDLN